METETADRATVEVKIENWADLRDVERGAIPADRVRRVVVPDTLADTGALMLSMPFPMIQRLGLEQIAVGKAMTRAGEVVEIARYGLIRLTILGRSCNSEVLEAPDDRTVRIGRITLASVDLVIDPIAGKVTGDPAHGGEEMYDLLTPFFIDSPDEGEAPGTEPIA